VVRAWFDSEDRTLDQPINPIGDEEGWHSLSVALDIGMTLGNGSQEQGQVERHP
jgi:hypothetical protein